MSMASQIICIKKKTELYSVAKLLEGDKKTCITRSVEQSYARVKYLDKEQLRFFVSVVRCGMDERSIAKYESRSLSPMSLQMLPC